MASTKNGNPAPLPIAPAPQHFTELSFQLHLLFRTTLPPLIPFAATPPKPLPSPRDNAILVVQRSLLPQRLRLRLLPPHLSQRTLPMARQHCPLAPTRLGLRLRQRPGHNQTRRPLRSRHRHRRQHRPNPTRSAAP